MAKGKIKNLLAPQDNMSMERNGVTLNFVPMELERGTGKYPGIKFHGEEKDKDGKVIKPEYALNLEQLESVLTKESVQKDAALKRTSFISFVLNAVNDLSKITWRSLVAEKPAETVLTADQWKTLNAEFIEAFNRALDGDRKEREKDSSFYRRLANKHMTAAKAEKDAAKRLELVKEAKSALAIAKQKEDEEMAAVLKAAEGLEGFEDLMEASSDDVDADDTDADVADIADAIDKTSTDNPLK